MLHGDNRKLLTKANDLKARIVHFKEKDQDIVNPYTSIDGENKLILTTEQIQNIDSQDNLFRAVLMEFSLNKGSYATMLIREFFHFSSSFENQEQFNSN